MIKAIVKGNMTEIPEVKVLKLSKGSVIAETSISFNSTKDSTTLKNDVTISLKNGDTSALPVEVNSINITDNTQSIFLYKTKLK